MSLQDAADDFSKAANMFKMAKNWDMAGNTYLRSANCHLQAGTPHEAASCYVSASNCFKKVDVQKAVDCIRKAIAYYTDEGRFNIAAKYQKEVAEMLEAEMDLDGAIEAYRTAAEYYEGENAASSADMCWLKVAQFCGQQGQLDEAINIYEKVASNSLTNNLRKYQAKEYFLRAGICRLCTGDAIAARRALERYQEMDFSFMQEREAKLLDGIINAVEELDVEAFTNAIVDYDSISKLDGWKTSMLLKIKNQINEQEEDLA